MNLSVRSTRRHGVDIPSRYCTICMQNGVKILATHMVDLEPPQPNDFPVAQGYGCSEHTAEIEAKGWAVEHLADFFLFISKQIVRDRRRGARERRRRQALDTVQRLKGSGV